MLTNKETLTDDVRSLSDRLQLGALKYHEFSKQPRAGRETAEASSPQVNTTHKLPQSSRARADEAPKKALLVDVTPAKTVESPLAFTFERLRRQALASAPRSKPLLLNLPERHTVRANAMRARLSRNIRSVLQDLESYTSD